LEGDTVVTRLELLGAAVFLAAILIVQPARPAQAAEPPTPPAHAAGPADLEVSWEETRSLLPRYYSWAWIKNVGSAPSDGIKVATWCGYLTEGGDVAERPAKPAVIMPALGPGERVMLNFDCNPWEGRTAIYGRVQATTDADTNAANNTVKKIFP
jgi:hypothetical protein